MHNIDLNAVLRTLYERQQTGLLTAYLTLPEYSTESDLPEVRIWLHEGILIECDIIKQQQRVMYGRDALIYVRQFPMLNWSFTASQATKNEGTGVSPSVVSENIGRMTTQWSSRPDYQQYQPSYSQIQNYQQSTRISGRMQTSPQNYYSGVQSAIKANPYYSEKQIPQRQGTSQQQTLQYLSFKQRRVYMLIDGARTIEGIAALIASSGENMQEIMTILAELEQMNIITFSAQ
jgi:hypothetical protein